MEIVGGSIANIATTSGTAALAFGSAVKALLQLEVDLVSICGAVSAPSVELALVAGRVAFEAPFEGGVQVVVAGLALRTASFFVALIAGGVAIETGLGGRAEVLLGSTVIAGRGSAGTVETVCRARNATRP